MWRLQIAGFLKVKGPLEEVEAALSSAPIAVPGLHKLVEGVRAGHEWVANINTLDIVNQNVDFKTLEGLVSDGQRLAVALPHWKVSRAMLRLSYPFLDTYQEGVAGNCKVVSSSVVSITQASDSTQNCMLPKRSQIMRSYTPFTWQASSRRCF